MFDVKIIENGFFMADGGAMFGAIPKRAWVRKYPPEQDNLCRLAMRSILVTCKNKKILIDLGMGDKHLDLVHYYQPHYLKDIHLSLQEHNCTAEDITDVIITHLHFDHCGYATQKDENGNIKPTFPNAHYWLSQKQWDNFQHPNLLEESAFFPENIIPVQDAGLLQLIDKDCELYEGFHIKLFDGHTSGQLVAYIETGDGTVTFPGDLIPTASHLSLDWISAYDLSAIMALKEKMRFLEEATEKDYTLIYCHDAYYTSSKVRQTKGKDGHFLYSKTKEVKID